MRNELTKNYINDILFLMPGVSPRAGKTPGARKTIYDARCSKRSITKNMEEARSSLSYLHVLREKLHALRVPLSHLHIRITCPGLTGSALLVPACRDPHIRTFAHPHIRTSAHTHIGTSTIESQPPSFPPFRKIQGNTSFPLLPDLTGIFQYTAVTMEWRRCKSPASGYCRICSLYF
jgi:hypothetical protein